MKSFTLLFVCALVALVSAYAPQGNAKGKTAPVQGAVQMPGDNGKIGTPYMLGKKGEELVFTLEKAEFASRLFHKQDAFFPDEGKRLLVLTYAIQNPSSSGDRPFSNQSFSFTVVSPDDENF